MAVTPLVMPARRPAQAAAAKLAWSSDSRHAERDAAVLAAAVAEGKGLTCERYGIRHAYEDTVRQWMECARCGALEVRDDWK